MRVGLLRVEGTLTWRSWIDAGLSGWAAYSMANLAGLSISLSLNAEKQLGC